MDIEKVVENIQRICKDRGTNPTEAGKKSGAGKDLVSIMRRRGSFPSIEKMSMLASYLGVTTSELLGEKQALLTVTDEERLDQELIERLCQLSPEELEKVDAFVQGLLASR